MAKHANASPSELAAASSLFCCPAAGPGEEAPVRGGRQIQPQRE